MAESETTTNQDPPQAPAPAKKTKPVKKYYVTTIAFRMWCPSQKKYITFEPSPLEMDSWLESQIKAKLVKEVEAP